MGDKEEVGMGNHGWHILKCRGDQRENNIVSIKVASNFTGMQNKCDKKNEKK